MRKKVSCKVIRSITLDGSILPDISFAADFKDCIQRVHKSFSGAFIYTERLEKKQLLCDDTTFAGIIDTYV